MLNTNFSLNIKFQPQHQYRDMFPLNTDCVRVLYKSNRGKSHPRNWFGFCIDWELKVHYDFASRVQNKSNFRHLAWLA